MVQDTDPYGNARMGDDVTLSLVNAALKVAKSADVSSVSAPQTMRYTITVNNSGDTNSNGALDPGESWSYSASYTVTQADIDAGTDLVNVAAAGVPVTVTQTPGISVDKTAAMPAALTAGEVIDCAITITNTGTVTLATPTAPVATLRTMSGAVRALDAPLVFRPGARSGAGTTAAEIPPGGVQDWTASYTLVQGDVDDGGVTNNALASGGGGRHDHPT